MISTVNQYKIDEKKANTTSRRYSYKSEAVNLSIFEDKNWLLVQYRSQKRISS